jgi:hypothetical protein
MLIHKSTYEAKYNQRKKSLPHGNLPDQSNFMPRNVFIYICPAAPLVKRLSLPGTISTEIATCPLVVARDASGMILPTSVHISLTFLTLRSYLVSRLRGKKTAKLSIHPQIAHRIESRIQGGGDNMPRPGKNENWTIFHKTRRVPC